MKIGCIGYYNHGNLGDDRILYCLKNYYDRHELIVLNDLTSAMNSITLLNSCDIVIFGGGGLILRGTNYFAPVIDQLKSKLFTIGVSVEARDSTNQKLIDALRRKSEAVIVRDIESKTLFCDESHSKNVIVAPDLTFLMPYNTVEINKDDTCGVNFRNWYWWNAEYKSREYYQMLEADNKDRNLKYSYVDRWDTKIALERIESNFNKIILLSLAEDPLMIPDSEIFGDASSKIVSWNDLATRFSLCRYVIGMRLHSLIFACQMGIPFLSLSYQAKNVNFCKDLELLETSIDIHDLKSIPSKIVYLKENFTRIREKLIEETQRNARKIRDVLHDLF